MSISLTYASAAGKAAAAGNFELELSVAVASSVPVELRAIEVGGTIGAPGTGKQVALRVLPNGVIEAHYFDGTCWTIL